MDSRGGDAAREGADLRRRHRAHGGGAGARGGGGGDGARGGGGAARGTAHRALHRRLALRLQLTLRSRLGLALPDQARARRRGLARA